MSGYDLPIQDDNEREYYANVGRIQEREAIIKLLEQKILEQQRHTQKIDTATPHHARALFTIKVQQDLLKEIKEREYTWNYS